MSGMRVFNNALYPIYVKLSQHRRRTPTAGAGVVKHGRRVQAGQRADVTIDGGHYFSTGIGMTIVKGIGDGDTTAVALSDCVVDVEFN
jgi:hypothetical protein